MVTNGLRLDGVKVSKIYRLGKKQDNKTWPLLVALDSFNVKKTILSNSSSLRKSEYWKDVFISPDLTPKEREANRLLLKRQKSAGEKNLIIKRGRIVTFNGNPAPASHQQNQSAAESTSH